jgi:hypothetical protein
LFTKQFQYYVAPIKNYLLWRKSCFELLSLVLRWHTSFLETKFQTILPFSKFSIRISKIGESLVKINSVIFVLYERYYSTSLQGEKFPERNSTNFKRQYMILLAWHTRGLTDLLNEFSTLHLPSEKPSSCFLVISSLPTQSTQRTVSNLKKRVYITIYITCT